MSGKYAYPSDELWIAMSHKPQMAATENRLGTSPKRFGWKQQILGTGRCCSGS
jgi:hypothetical protein